MKPARRAALLGLAVGALLVVVAPAGWAHALLRGSDPPNGAELDAAPKVVTLTFTERPDLGLSVVHVVDRSGADVERGPAIAVPGHPDELQVALGSIGKGVYTVTWRVVSKVDGHVTAGSFTFGVQQAPGPAGAVSSPVLVTPSPSALAAVARWALYAGLALLVGAAAVAVFAFRGEVPQVRLVVGSWVLSLTGLGLMIVAERSTVGVSFGRLFRSSTGHHLLWQAAGIAATGLAVLWLALRPSATGLLIVAAAAIGTMLLHSLAGHAAATGHFEWLDVGVQWLHLVAVGVWVGGLAWMVQRTRRAAPVELAASVKRFSTMAGLALAVVAATGVQRAISEVGGPTAWGRLIHTSFGLTLVVKIGLFVGLVALGARNRYVNVPGVMARDRARFASLRRTIGAEVVIAAGVLGVTGVLTQLPPAATVASVAPRPAQFVVVRGSDFATTVRVSLTVTPGTVGPNRFEARVVDYDTGRPVPASSVRLQFTLPGRPELGTPTLDLAESSPGLWTGQGTVLSMDGAWDVTVVVQKPTEAVTVPLRLQTRLPPETIKVIPGGSGQPTVYQVQLADGAFLQAYVEPAVPGPNTVHFTFFQPNGSEQSIGSVSALATPPSGLTADLPLTRFDMGHFVANTQLVSGRWRFQITASSSDGAIYSAYFSQSIP